MLSRAAILSGQNSRALVAYASRASSATASGQDSSKGPLWQRPVRQEPGKVRMGFIPDEWFTFFYKKTGVTGPYTFGFTLSTYLISKEIYVMEHEFYNGLSLAIMWIAGIKLLGPKLAKALDKEIDNYEAEWNESRVQDKETLQNAIEDEKKNQWRMEGQTMLVQAKRENVALQLEAAYRERLLEAYTQVKKRLDYQVEKQNIERRIAQKNLVDWVVRKVKASITPDQEKQNIDNCIATLGNLIPKV
ncbi:ATP synthase subunit b, mitochondrial [Tribolium castaneum]|uniref:ATP synthase subunit b n=1 Tax=Tribolium castaneum TaxID=7070 RepID=D6WSF6_TRICA|nr:PREDICTED: ATP synthase subunit b, mitochondrial [Tribolium castaneum]EFA07499.1 ATP synthase subunit b, mitochondrial-like Protein [Tribolium castaneum]|eukprot:XP_973076.1 PREDICTED: ATP synthase subunit b, mitochondrial [Tribolium castaneum]